MKIRLQVAESPARQEQWDVPGTSLSWWQSAETGKVYKEDWFSYSVACLQSEDQHLQLVL